MTPLHIKLLLHVYAIAEPIENRNSPAVSDYLQQLQGMKLIVCDSESESGFRITALGNAHIKQILCLSLPKQVFIGADGKIIGDE